MTSIKHDYDWRTAPPPWNTLGPKIAARVRHVIEQDIRAQAKENPEPAPLKRASSPDLWR